MRPSNLRACRLLEIPTVSDPRGNLGFLNELEHVPFSIARSYFLWGVPDGASRGGHAHKNLQQFLIVLNGSLEVALRDDREEMTFSLNHPTTGLFIDRMIWRDLRAFSGNNVTLVLASELYNPDDYIRDFHDYEDLMRLATNHKG